MDKVLLDYIAGKILEDLRSGKSFPSKFYNAIIGSSLKTPLREKVKKGDIGIIKKLLNSKHKNEIVLGHILMRKLLHIPGIRTLVEDKWKNSNKPDVKIAILYDLLEYTGFTHKKMNSFFKYLCNNRKKYEDHVINWYGGRDKIVDGISPKLSDPKLKHKRWIYLYNLSVSNETKRAKNILKGYLLDKDNFVKKVAQISFKLLK